MPKRIKFKANYRTHSYSLRLSDLELEWLHMKAKDAGMSGADLIRRLTFTKPLPKRISKISLTTYQELGRIGNNLNQLTRVANTAIKMGYPPPAKQELLEELLELLHECRRQLAQVDIDDEDDDLESEDFSDDWETD
ncbi:MAG: MobC family plasmid mobilization relaxosome protein [Fischerella sp. CENA71]|nr:MobC family plasmid mobilization relaxosome protein [Fischerella sp. CENA71]